MLVSYKMIVYKIIMNRIVAYITNYFTFTFHIKLILFVLCNDCCSISMANDMGFAIAFLVLICMFLDGFSYD